MAPDGDSLLDAVPGRPPALPSLIDAAALRMKLERQLGEVVTHAQQKGLPKPVGRYAGELLWDEAAVDAWLAGEV